MTGKAIMTAAALLLSAAPSAAQVSPFSVEVRGRAAFPTGDFGEEDETGRGVKTGWGGSLTGYYQATPQLAVYAGYSLTRFPTDLGDVEEAELEFLGIDDASIDIDDKGFDAGLRVTLPAGAATAFVRGGLVYHRSDLQLSEELEDAISVILDPDELDSDWSLGYQIGAGLLLPLGPRLSASLGASYTAYDPEFEFDRGGTDSTSEGDLTYASIELGLEFRP